MEVGRQDAALKVDGVSCYVLLSTSGRSLPTLFSTIQTPCPSHRRREVRHQKKNIILNLVAGTRRTDNLQFTL